VASGCPADEAPSHPLLDNFHTPAAAAARHRPLQSTPQIAANALQPAERSRDAPQLGGSRRASGFVRIKRHAGEASKLEAAKRADTVLHEGAGQFAASKQHSGVSPRLVQPAPDRHTLRCSIKQSVACGQ
jgi:hypothetical protein